jgi:quercetin dioxygenase-like cupin family protein
VEEDRMTAVAALMRPKVLALEDVLRSIPQVDIETKHFFAQGMYIRMAEIKKGCTFVGKEHKAEHFFILVKGRLAVTVGDEVQTLEAGAVVVSGAGTKRAGHALEDCVFMNVHRTDLTDLDEIELELIEPDERALFDSANRIKVEALK